MISLSTNCEYTTKSRITKMSIIRKNIILPELSYAIVGALFDVFNDLGTGLREKYYYSAIKESLEKRGLEVRQQAHNQLKYKEALIGKLFLEIR